MCSWQVLQWSDISCAGDVEHGAQLEATLVEGLPLIFLHLIYIHIYLYIVSIVKDIWTLSPSFTVRKQAGQCSSSGSSFRIVHQSSSKDRPSLQRRQPLSSSSLHLRLFAILAIRKDGHRAFVAAVACHPPLLALLAHRSTTTNWL